MRSAQRKVLVADFSKFLRRKLCRIVPFSEIDCVITDKGLPDPMRTSIRALGLELILV